MIDNNVEPGLLLASHPVEFMHLFEKGWTYPERPMKTNDYTPYRLLRATSPSSFFVELGDETSRNIANGISQAIRDYRSYIFCDKRGINIPINCIREQMPVAVLVGQEIYRAEVNAINADLEKVNVTFVDTGEERWVKMSELYAPSTGLLRHPKLAMHCRLAQVVPILGSKGWAKFDYPALLQGKKTSLLCPVSIDRGIYDVYLQCDGKDVAVHTVFQRLAKLVPLQHFRDDLDKRQRHQGVYPLNDFSNWIGMLIPVFGVKVRTPNQVVLQLDPQSANDIYDAIEKYVNSNPNLDKEPFEKKVGSACLARFTGLEYCRATIIAIPEPDYFLVKYVDYCDYDVVKESELVKIPKILTEKPEAATLCSIHGLTHEKLTDKETFLKMKEMVEDKDIFCRIEASDYVSENKKNKARVLVSLSQPLGVEGDDVSFVRLFDTPDPPLNQKYVNIYPLVGNEVGVWLLGASSNFFPDVKYSGILSCAESERSVWLQLEEDSMKAENLAKEMTEFYNSCKELVLAEERALTGTYVAVKQEVDGQWYRGRIMGFNPNLNLYQVLFLDFGNHEGVPISTLKPLTAYFAKYPSLALQTALPVKLREGVDLNELSNFIIWFCENTEEGMEVLVKHVTPFNVAWIQKKNGESLNEELIKKGFATEVIHVREAQPSIPPPPQELESLVK